MNTETDAYKAENILPMTHARHLQLQADMERSTKEMASLLRRGGSPQRFRELRMLQGALDVAQKVLSSFHAPGH